MERRIGGAVGSATLVVMLTLTGCASTNPTDAGASANPGTTTPAATPISDINTAVQTFVTALDDLGIKHTDPVRADVGMSGAKARFDITVNGYDAGINVVPDAKTLAAWG